MEVLDKRHEQYDTQNTHHKSRKNSRHNDKIEGGRKTYAIKPNVDDKTEDKFLDVTLLSSKKMSHHETQ